ncbi:hypothetical protein [Microcystis phage Mae-JY09]
MAPDPAPYGADLPRPYIEDIEWFIEDAPFEDYLAALDAANAEVLRLREVVERARDMCARPCGVCLPAPTEGDG